MTLETFRNGLSLHLIRLAFLLCHSFSRLSSPWHHLFSIWSHPFSSRPSFSCRSHPSPTPILTTFLFLVSSHALYFFSLSQFSMTTRHFSFINPPFLLSFFLTLFPSLQYLSFLACHHSPLALRFPFSFPISVPCPLLPLSASPFTLPHQYPSLRFPYFPPLACPVLVTSPCVLT